MRVSHNLSKIQEKIEGYSRQVDKIKTKVDKLTQIRLQLRTERRTAENEWRKLSSEMVEEGGSQVLKVQIRIGDLKAKITELTTKISSEKTSLEGLRIVGENHLQQYKSMKDEIDENRRTRSSLRRKQRIMSNNISQKQAEHDRLAKEAVELWERMQENSGKIREIEKQLDDYYEKLTDFKSENAKSRETIKIHKERTQTLKTRKERLMVTSKELEGSLGELQKVREEQKEQIKRAKSRLERRIGRREVVEKEITEAGKIAETAREAIIEFATQRELAEALASEEAALRNVEELGELGVIPGVHGRLRNLIKLRERYRPALEATAAGWLDALVVKNSDTAFTCTETLRKMKLGRVKIIPTENTLTSEPLKTPNGRGIYGKASSFVKCIKKYTPAVNYVFGDTMLVSNDQVALSLSSKGYRSVTLNGDVYEAGGALESGYYRAPIDFSKIIPSEAAIKSLDEAVGALQQHLSSRSNYITSIEEEVERTRVEIALLSEASITIEGEINRVKRSISRTVSNIKRINKLISRFVKKVENEKKQMWLRKVERNTIKKERRKLQKKLSIIRNMTDPTNIQGMEIKREKSAEEIINLRQKLGSIETENSTLQSKYDNVLRVGYKNAKIQLKKVEQQLTSVENEISVALEKRELLREEVAELEGTRVELSRTVLSAREESKKFTVKIDSIDQELQKLDSEYEPADRLLNELQLKLQTSSMQLQQEEIQLTKLGYSHPLEVTSEQVANAITSIRMMQLELERIGAVNQLALSHYAEQISRYKELSLRLNELEKEKTTIVEFMDEIERRKFKVFIEAFEKINTDLQKYFSKVTGGGSATLALENKEDPFSGGIDMTVQFPNKPSIVVSGASGGERSVAAVAFIFALKEFTPASFYILDEIDAHLDAFHVSKLADLLLEESEKTQFIVVTLKPETVNKAEKVYGVYERNGVSNVVSARFLEMMNQ